MSWQTQNKMSSHEILNFSLLNQSEFYVFVLKIPIPSLIMTFVSNLRFLRCQSFNDTIICCKRMAIYSDSPWMDDTIAVTFMMISLHCYNVHLKLARNNVKLDWVNPSNHLIWGKRKSNVNKNYNVVRNAGCACSRTTWRLTSFFEWMN